MPPDTSSRLRQGPTHVTDTGRCPTPCPNPTEVTQLGQLSLCCSRSGASPSSRACSVLIPALRLSRAAVCAATELSVCCSQDLSDLRTVSVLRPDRRGEPVVTRDASHLGASVKELWRKTSSFRSVLFAEIPWLTTHTVKAEWHGMGLELSPLALENISTDNSLR